MELAQSLRSITADDTSGGRPDEPCVLVVFGANGDLTHRLLLPALYNLACDGLLPEPFAFIGVGRSDMSDAEYRDRMSDGIAEFTTGPQLDTDVWEALARRLQYLSGSYEDPRPPCGPGCQARRRR
jgi:glucose-6-phosphate 1-dehydrogenase